MLNCRGGEDMFNFRTLKENIEEMICRYKKVLSDEKDLEVLNCLASKDIQKISAKKRVELTYNAETIKQLLGYNKPLAAIFTDEEEELDYKYGDLIKKNFIHSLTDKWETEKSIRTVARYLKEVEVIEDKFNKPVYEFNDEEVQYAIRDLFVNTNYYAVRLRVKSCMDMQAMYAKYLSDDISKSWETYFKSDSFRTLVGQEDAISVREIKALFDILDNAQDGVVPALIFEGVKLEDVEEDELRFLKKTDIKDGCVVVNKGKETERRIEIPSDVERMVNSAIQQEFMVTTNKKRDYIELADNEYVLRPAKTRRLDTEDASPMRYRGVFSRVRHIAEQFNATLSHKTMTPRSIRNSGKYYYINKYIAEGYDRWEAFRQTLKRFGEWKYSDGYEAEKRDPYNKQKVDRIKKLWEAYNNGRNRDK